MDTRLALLVALVFLLLLSNTLLLWFLFRAVARSARYAARYQRHCEVFVESLRTLLEEAQVASVRATQMSARLRDGVVDATQNVDRADNWLQYGMAKVDFKVDRVSAELNESAQEVQQAISEPLYRSGAIVQGVKALLEFLVLSRSREGNLRRY
jgi:hypothetical protein